MEIRSAVRSSGFRVAQEHRRRELQANTETFDMDMCRGLEIGSGAARGSGHCFAIALCCGALTAREARAQEAPASTPGAISLDQLLRMDSAELEMLYRQGTGAAMPVGRLRGTAILAPGSRRARALSRGARLVWQGK